MIKSREFIPNRNQNRTVKKNQDLSVEFHDLAPSFEKISLLQKFFAARFPEHPKSASVFYSTFFCNTSNFSHEIHYRSGSRLIGVAIVDMGNKWLNAVYFFFDPESAARSPGTFNILQLLDVCKTKQLDKLYLGYLINEVKAMRYKSSFSPHYLFRNGAWQKSPKNSPPER